MWTKPNPRSFARILLPALFLAALCVAKSMGTGKQSAPGDPGVSIQTLGWISGAWGGPHDQTQVEEYWTDVGGNMILGVGRTLAGGRTVFFEFLRIEARPDGIYYVAQPKGRPGADFKLTRGNEAEAIFENPAHDFPKRIIYRRNADGTITARIDGGMNVAAGAQEFHYRPLKKM